MAHPWIPYPGMPFTGVPMMNPLPDQSQLQNQNQLQHNADMMNMEPRQPLTTLTNVQPSVTANITQVQSLNDILSLTEGHASTLNVIDDTSGKEKTTQRGQKRKPTEDTEGQGNEVAASPSTVALPQQTQPVIFCKVIGRLSVVGGQRSYYVTANEIFRRTSLPECMQRSHLIPLLRRGKIKNCGKELQDLLEEKGLSAAYRSDLPMSRHRKPTSTLSAFLEDEAVQLSSDHREIVLAHFPLTALARLVVRECRNPNDLPTFAAETKAAMTVMDEFVVVLDTWTNGGWTNGMKTILSTPLDNFALSTHALGVEECLLFTSLFSRFLHILDEEYAAQISRVADYLAVHNLYPMMINQFPPGLELPEIPNGCVHIPDIDEQSVGMSHFAEIPGRLTLLNKKYNVTVAEIFRRVRAPESLNLSILGSLLKKGKTKDNGNELRDELKKYGINIDQGRRKSARITAFTAMLEGESVLLSSDVEAEVRRSFPEDALINTLLTHSPATTRDTITAKQLGFKAASRLASSLSILVTSLRLPVVDRAPHIPTHAHLLLNYSSLTHGYGPDACISWMGVFHSIFEKASLSLPIV